MREVHPRLGPADLVTLVRAVPTAMVLGLAVWSFVQPVPGWVIVALSVPALALDAVDGWVARRTHSATPRGARFDMETDAILILGLSLYVVPTVGWWVLVIGLARYLLLAAQAVWPLLRGDVPPRLWRKTVAAVQGVVLVVAASGLLPDSVTTALLAAALMLLVASFATEVRERVTDRASGVSWGALVSGLALMLVWVALAAPSGGSDLSPALFVRVPVEGVVLVGIAVLLPTRWSDRLALPFGLLAAIILVLKGLNVGFSMVLDRPFDLIGDWGYFPSAVGVLGDSVGRPTAQLITVLVVCLALSLCVVLPLATRRVCRVARRHPVRAGETAAALAVLALVLGVAGVDLYEGKPVLVAVSADLALDEVRDVRAGLHDRAVFAQEIDTDRFEDTPAHQLLDRLRGKDVLLLFVESYGRSALRGSSYSPRIDAVLEAGNRRLGEAGYQSRSAYLTSPTFGAGSWLAHSTTQSGVWVNSQRRYDQLLSADRLTLTGAFRRAGWRSVFVVPANTRDWPEGADFYGFDALYDARNVGYRGPKFGYASMPDQYTLHRFREQELIPAPRSPVMAEIDLVSSHHPWAPLPQLVAWNRVGDGSVFDGMPEEGDSYRETLSDRDRVRQAYGESITYSLDTVVSFLTTYPDDDLVVVMLGDHEPYHYVSGADPGHDVPVSIITRDPKVIERISGWHWSTGVRPAVTAPVWRMDSLRDRFLMAFSSTDVGE